MQKVSIGHLQTNSKECVFSARCVYLPQHVIENPEQICFSHPIHERGSAT